MYTLYFHNMGYSPCWRGKTQDAAIAEAKRRGFEATILRKGEVVGCWGPLTGFSRV